MGCYIPLFSGTQSDSLRTKQHAMSQPHERVVVVGGGMAAVYAAWQLQRQLQRARHSPIKEILVLNADADWGGRVHTVYDAKGTALYEAGAARFFASHTHLV